jgi:CRP/FNR family transcriptional regulator
MNEHRNTSSSGAYTSKQGYWSEALQATYPELAAIREPGWLEIIERARPVRVPANTRFLNEGDRCDGFVLVLEGVVRIYQLAKDGRSATLYRVHPGDICILSLNSLVQKQPFTAFAETESDVSGLGLSDQDFMRAMRVSESFSRHMLGKLVGRYREMMSLVQDTVFNRLDMRLACLLGRLFERARSDTLHITHQELANELGTSREVISRILKEFERQDCIRLSRGKIHLFSAEGLAWFTTPEQS